MHGATSFFLMNNGYSVSLLVEEDIGSLPVVNKKVWFDL